jgi:hypothetical protein
MRLLAFSFQRFDALRTSAALSTSLLDRLFMACNSRLAAADLARAVRRQQQPHNIISVIPPAAWRPHSPTIRSSSH